MKHLALLSARPLTAASVLLLAIPVPAGAQGTIIGGLGSPLNPLAIF